MPGVPRVLSRFEAAGRVQLPYRTGSYYTPGLFVDAGIGQHQESGLFLAANCYGSIFTVPSELKIAQVGVRTHPNHTDFTSKCKIAFYIFDGVDFTHDLIGYVESPTLAVVSTDYFAALNITLPAGRQILRVWQGSVNKAAGLNLYCESYISQATWPVGRAWTSTTVLDGWRESVQAFSIPRTYGDPFPAVLSGTHTNIYGNDLSAMPLTFMQP